MSAAEHAPIPLGRPRAPQLDPELLHEIVRAVSSSLDLTVVLRSVVDLVTRAVGCHACYVFLADDDGRMVVEACSSDRYADYVGKVALEPGEGLAGWVARRRTPVFLADDALADPRMRIFDEFEEHKYQSLVSLPLIGKGGDVLGVIAAHGEGPREFTQAEQRFLLSSAALAAGAIENARLYGETSRRVDVLERLVQLSRRIAEADSLDVLLREVTSRLVPLLGAGCCRVYLTDRDHGTLRLRASSPPSPGAVASLSLEDVGPALGADRARLERLTQAVRNGEAPGAPWLFLPIAASGELLGLLAVSGRVGRRFGTHDRDLAAAVVAQTAVAVKKVQLLERLEERNLIKDFLDDLASGDAPPTAARERRLRCRLDVPRVVLVARRLGAEEAGDGTDESAWTLPLEARLAALFHGALLDRSESGLRALLPSGASSPAELLASVRDAHRAVSTPELPIAVGLSAPCAERSGYPTAFEEAGLALSAAGVLHRRASVVAFDELGPYKYLLRLSLGSGARDHHCDRLRLLLEYDDAHHSQLFLTLEEYFRQRGRVATTAATLYIHPNTLRQRLGRIAAITGLDVEHEDPLTLELAMKLVKLGGGPARAGR